VLKSYLILVLICFTTIANAQSVTIDSALSFLPNASKESVNYQQDFLDYSQTSAPNSFESNISFSLEEVSSQTNIYIDASYHYLLIYSYL